jgi:inosine-uridine nucleoside N-ribohydrolase
MSLSSLTPSHPLTIIDTAGLSSHTPSLQSTHSSSSNLKPDDFQDRIDNIRREMERRATNLPYGLGVGLRNAFNSGSINSVDVSLKSAKRNDAASVALSTAVPFDSYYQQLFPGDTISVFYIGMDPGVDDTAALGQLLAAHSKQNEKKKIEIFGFVPSVGNVDQEQSEKNTMQFLELTQNQALDVYSGSLSPLAMENNQTAINEMLKGIKETHFYGFDGESDVGGWPKVTMRAQLENGYLAAASKIYSTSVEKPITVITTSSLTDCSKTLSELVRLDSISGLPEGSFAKKIAALSIMGGCIRADFGCNAPFNIPTAQKTSEANFFFDAPAAKNVFEICQKYNIPILLATLDLTQEPGLMWSSEQVAQLRSFNNPVAKQMARVTEVVPYLDKPVFPEGTYPMHDLHAVTNLLFPDFYNVTCIAASIGDIGQIIINPNENVQRNVFILGMNVEKQSSFYQTVLSQYGQFDHLISSGFKWSKAKITGLAVGLAGFVGCAVLGVIGLRFYFGKNRKNIDETTSLIVNSKAIELATDNEV